LIGGAKFAYLNNAGAPGLQTSNATVILDGSSFTTNTFTQGLVIQTSGVISAPFINAISNSSTLTTLGSNSGNELATTYAIKYYIDLNTGANASPQGTNGSFQYNNSGILAGTNNFFFDNTTGAITVGNSSVNVQLGYVSGGGQQMQHWHGNANTYMQIQMTNANTGTSASADFIINADNYTDATNYLDLGINNSLWSNTLWTINGADDGYLYAANGAMSVGTASAKPVTFFANGTLATNEVMRIDSGANVGIGNTTPNAKLQVTGTANVSGNVAIAGITTFNGSVTIGAVALIANGSAGTNGQVLVSNSTGVFWGTGTSGTNTQIQFNDSGVANATAGFTFTKTTNTLFVGNTITVGANTTIANNSYTIAGNTSSLPTVTVSYSGIVIGNTTSTGATTINIANTSGNATVNTTIIQVASSIGTANLVPNALTIGNSIVNATAIAVGANIVTNTTSTVYTGSITVPTTTISSAGLTTGNSSVTGVASVQLANSAGNATVNTTIIQVANSIGTANMTPTAFAVGISTVNSIAVSIGANVFANSSTLTFVGNTTAQPTASMTFTGVTVGNSSVSGSATVGVANSIGNTTINTTSIGTSWGFNANSTAIYYGVGFSANSSLVNAAAVNVVGQVNTATLYAATSANVGTFFTANSTVVNAIAITTANVTTTTNVTTIGTSVYFTSNGNVGFGGNAAPSNTLSVSGTAYISGNAIFAGANVLMQSSTLSVRDAIVSGNLTVQGTLTTIDSLTLQVKDPLIKLADQNTTTDTIDAGFYSVAGNTISTYFTGIYRDHASSTLTAPVYKIFSSNVEPTNIVDNTQLGYTLGTLNAYLLAGSATGGFLANSTNVNITANSAVAVTIVANSVTLSTALAASSGGTGQNTYTAGDILYASGSAALSKLSVTANGQVLQITNNLPAYGTLDGGTF